MECLFVCASLKQTARGYSQTGGRPSLSPVYPFNQQHHHAGTSVGWHIEWGNMHSEDLHNVFTIPPSACVHVNEYELIDDSVLPLYYFFLNFISFSSQSGQTFMMGLNVSIYWNIKVEVEKVLLKVRSKLINGSSWCFLCLCFASSFRLREINMSEYDAATYERFSKAVRRQVQSLRIILDSLQVGIPLPRHLDSDILYFKALIHLKATFQRFPFIVHQGKNKERQWNYGPPYGSPCKTACVLLM